MCALLTPAGYKAGSRLASACRLGLDLVSIRVEKRHLTCPRIASEPSRPRGPCPDVAPLTQGAPAILARLLPLSILVFTAIAGATPARADFRLCNNTANRVSVSLAYTDGGQWISEGWWNLKTSGCETLVRGPLAAEFYYVYAMDERGGEWKGKAFMCTRDREFKITGRDECFVRGFDRTGFFEVDTGKDAKNWTVQLTEAGAARPNP
jgi:uncharacterized membrane protein